MVPISHLPSISEESAPASTLRQLDYTSTIFHIWISLHSTLTSMTSSVSMFSVVLKGLSSAAIPWEVSSRLTLRIRSDIKEQTSQWVLLQETTVIGWPLLTIIVSASNLLSLLVDSMKVPEAFSKTRRSTNGLTHYKAEEAASVQSICPTAI